MKPSKKQTCPWNKCGRKYRLVGENCKGWYCDIPKKKKMVTVKAWAFIDGSGSILCYDKNPRHKDAVPCTVIIDAKYLKERK